MHSTRYWGVPSYLLNARCSSCLDLTFVSRSIFTKVDEFAEGDNGGSDHIFTYISISIVHDRLRRGSAKSTKWASFKDSMGFTCDTIDSLEAFENAMLLLWKDLQQAAFWLDVETA